MAAGSVIGRAFEVTSQLLASLTVTEYEPTGSPEISSVAENEDCVDHLYINGLVPPDTEILNAPFEPP